MGADQQFCLRWNNFHTNITSAFESLRDDEDFVDITLACEGRQIKAHKMVLSACSPYFRSLLRGNPCQHPIVFLKDVTFANLTSILDFMYHGEVNVSHNELATFLKTAEALRVRGLAEDEKKKEGDTCTESSSPPPPRDPPEPCSPGRPDDTGGGEGGSRVTIGDSRSSGGGEANSTTSGDPVGPPPTKRQRRRSGGTGAVAIISAVTGSTSSDHLHHQQQQHDHTGTMNTTSSSSSSHTNNDPMSQHQGDRSVRENVKNEPEDYINDDDDMLGGGGSSSQGGQQQHQQQQPPIAPEDIKLDGFSGEDGSGEYNLTDSVSITSRSQAAIQQQLQDTFSTFIPVAGQNPSFLQGHGNPGSSDHSRHPSFSLEGVQGLPPGISALPGTSMSQGGSSQDGPGQGDSTSPGCTRRSPKKGGSTNVLYQRTNCPLCAGSFFNKYSLKRHMIQAHNVNHVHTRPYSSFTRLTSCSATAAAYSASLQEASLEKFDNHRASKNSLDGLWNNSQTNSFLVENLPSSEESGPRAATSAILSRLMNASSFARAMSSSAAADDGGLGSLQDSSNAAEFDGNVFSCEPDLATNWSNANDSMSAEISSISASSAGETCPPADCSEQADEACEGTFEF